MTYPAIFDGHNDVLARLWLADHISPADAFLQQQLPGHLDFKRCKAAGFAGGLFAIFVPPYDYVVKHHPNKIISNANQQYSPEQIAEIFFAQLACLQQIENKSEQRVKICKNVADIRHCMQHDILAVVMHIEGAEVHDPQLTLIDTLYEQGLRSIGPLWNLPNQFGHGLNAPFPHSPDTGEGLTPLGKQLIQKCCDKRIQIDVSHMNEKAFWDTARLSTLPLVATHSNVHTICPQARNLTDNQLEAIKDSHGFVGVNFDTAFLRRDGKRNADTPIDVLIEHVEYLMDKLGEDKVGFGSDLDGGFISSEIGDVLGFQRIIDAFKQRGYSTSLMNQLCHENWLSVLERVWGQ